MSNYLYISHVCVLITIPFVPTQLTEAWLRWWSGERGGEMMGNNTWFFLQEENRSQQYEEGWNYVKVKWSVTLLWETTVEMQDRCATEGPRAPTLMAYSAGEAEEGQRWVVAEEIKGKSPLHFTFITHATSLLESRNKKPHLLEAFCVCRCIYQADPNTLRRRNQWSVSLFRLDANNRRNFNTSARWNILLLLLKCRWSARVWLSAAAYVTHSCSQAQVICKDFTL